MKIFNIRHIIIAVITAVIGLNSLPIYAQTPDPLDGKAAKKIVENLTKDYKNWNKAAWSGKARTPKLPVSATIRTYMERDRLTLISLRAPFVGEVARIEVDRDSAIVVNKMSKKYAVVDFSRFGSLAPQMHAALQSFLLGRAVVFPLGELSRGNADSVKVLPLEQGGYMVIPDIPDGFERGLYGYTFDSEGLLSALAFAIGDRQMVLNDTVDGVEEATEFVAQYQAQAEVTYTSGGADANITLDLVSRQFTASIEAGKIEWGAKGMDRISLQGLRKADLRGVLSF